ncbi:MAG: glutamyl-tRNA reductase, partial [Desulfobacterales bacterium]|nr:glutamyl-tRNA reductase [Desulfobacterales bacterium]
MLDIILLGLNHKTAPVELRERLAFSKDETVAALEAFQKDPAVIESVLFSTCNRMEILLATDNRSDALKAAKMFISEFKNIPVASFENALYIHNGDEAVRHIFRVASSLDSMMVGEP